MDPGSIPDASNPNPDPAPSAADAAPAFDTGIEVIARRVQESLSLLGANRHRLWETLPVSQFRDLGDTSLPEGPIKAPTPLSNFRCDPYNLPAAYEWTTCDIDDDHTCKEAVELIDGEIAPAFASLRKHREATGSAYYDAGTYAQGPFA